MCLATATMTTCKKASRSCAQVKLTEAGLGPAQEASRSSHWDTCRGSSALARAALHLMGSPEMQGVAPSDLPLDNEAWELMKNAPSYVVDRKDPRYIVRDIPQGFVVKKPVARGNDRRKSTWLCSHPSSILRFSFCDLGSHSPMNSSLWGESQNRMIH